MIEIDDQPSFLKASQISLGFKYFFFKKAFFISYVIFSII